MQHVPGVVRGTDGRQGTGGESRGTLYKLDIMGNYAAVARQRDRV